MQLDDEVCLCFHVTKRKIINYIRVEKPRRPGQLADCFGAGTGCGWCRTYLKLLFENAQRPDAPEVNDPDSSAYALGRGAYIRAGKGVPPPGATPIEPEGDASPPR